MYKAVCKNITITHATPDGIFDKVERVMARYTYKKNVRFTEHIDWERLTIQFTGGGKTFLWKVTRASA